MKKRTKIIIISAMVLLLGVTGYLNIVLNRQVSTNNPPASVTTTSSYFSAYRMDREALRDQILLALDSTIANENSSSEAKKNAENKKIELMDISRKEFIAEGLIIAKGFDECVVTYNDSKVNTVVKAADLTDEQVAQIVDVLQSTLDIKGIKNIKIMTIE